MNDVGKRLYIQNLAMYGLKTKAADGTGFSHDTFERLRRTDEDFDLKCEQAMAVFRDSLEEVAIDRAKEGWDEPVYQQGMMVGTKRKFDHTLLLALLKRHIPEFRDRATLDHNVSGGVLVVGDPQKTVDEWLEKHGGET
ncbi:MAG: hypothetical protein ACYSYL_14765 [Planctomycetota bacterium]|jgi:hypothetical protein